MSDDDIDEEQLDNLRGQLQGIRDTAASWRRLLAMPEWAGFQEFMDTQVGYRRDKIELAVVEGMDSMITVSHLNAELSGLRLGAEYVQTALDALMDEEHGLVEVLQSLEDQPEKET